MRYSEFSKIINEVKIITPGNINEPLRDNESVVVYHGTSDYNFLIAAIKYGLTGDMRASRRYSYEFNNNPKGLFVTPLLKTAKEFGSYVLEIHARVSDLDIPVWPNGSFTVQGGMSGIFHNEKEREDSKKQQRDSYSHDENEYIASSDRPELAGYLYDLGEPQALFIGDIDTSGIKAVWISSNPERVQQDYIRYKPQQVIKLDKQNKLPSRFGDVSTDKKSEIYQNSKNKVIRPRDYPTFDEFVDIILAQKSHLDNRDQVKSILKKHPDYIRDIVWSDRQYEKIIKTM